MENLEVVNMSLPEVRADIIFSYLYLISICLYRTEHSPRFALKTE